MSFGGSGLTKQRGRVVATSLSATWHLVLVLQMREGEGGCKCSLLRLLIVMGIVSLSSFLVSSSFVLRPVL